MNRTVRTIIGLLFLVGVLWGLRCEEARPALTGQVCHYHIQVENSMMQHYTVRNP